jgi:hypothetical protein
VRTGPQTHPMAPGSSVEQGMVLPCTLHGWLQAVTKPSFRGAGVCILPTQRTLLNQM